MNKAFYYRRGSKEGLLNEHGIVVLEPIFDDIGPFHNGYAAFRASGQYGIVSDNGIVLIQESFDSILVDGETGSGIPVKKNGKWGYIDLMKNMIIPLIYEHADPFSDGMAAVAVDQDNWIYLNKEGTVCIDGNIMGSHPFSCGRKRSDVIPEHQFNRDGLFGYIDKQGKMVIDPVYKYASQKFSEDRASVKTSDDRYGVIDINGRFIIDHKYRFIGQFSGGFATASMSDNRWAIMDRSGAVNWECTAKDISTPFHGYVKCELKNGLCGLYDIHGNEAIPPVYAHVSYWGDAGIATVRNIHGKYGAIEIASGRVVVECIYENDFNFKGNLALVNLKDGVGYINREGKLIFLFN